MGKNKIFKVIIDSRIDKETKEILYRYWNFKGVDFPEQIGKICSTYDRSTDQFYSSIRKYSKASITDYCFKCDQEVSLSAYSQKKFLEYYQGKNLCVSCKKIETEKLAKERKERALQYIQYRYSLLDEALEESPWLKLTQEENRMLLFFIESPNQDVDSGPFKNLDIYTIREIIEKFVSLGLLDRGSEFDWNDRAYGFSALLPEKLQSYLKQFEIKPKEHFSTSWSRISFELKKNKGFQNRDTPLNSGTIIFEEDVIIKAGTKCLYGLWPRENENTWLSITPVSDVIVSKNKSIDHEPEPIRLILRRIINNKL